MTETTLSEYIADPYRRARLASELGTSSQYLWQLATRWRGRKPSPELARKIEAATRGEVTRHDLLPDVFDPPTAQHKASSPAERCDEAR